MAIRSMRPRPRTADYRLLWNFMEELPPDGRWNADWRWRWLRAFTASLDYCVVLDEEVARWPSQRPESVLNLDIAQIRWWEQAS